MGFIYKRLKSASYKKFWELCYSCQLEKVKHLADIEDYNLAFQLLATSVHNISGDYFLQDYMSGLKEDIKHNVLLKHSKNIIEAM